MDNLILLSDLIKAKNSVDNIIANLVGRPAQVGHVGEYIASVIFDIELNMSASQKDIDGYFRGGPLAEKSVNVKWYTKHDTLLDVKEDSSTDYYLVFTGPKTGAISSRREVRPWVIVSVFLFDAHQLADTLHERGKKLGVATSVAVQLWHDAEIYPNQNNMQLELSETQREQLALFQLGA